MKTVQKLQRVIVLSLPNEALAQLQAKAPFVFKKMGQSVARFMRPADARAFSELVAERLAGLGA